MHLDEYALREVCPCAESTAASADPRVKAHARRDSDVARHKPLEDRTCRDASDQLSDHIHTRPDRAEDAA